MSKQSKTRKKIKPSSKLPTNRDENEQNQIYQDITANYIQTPQSKIERASKILNGESLPDKFKFREYDLSCIEQKLKQLMMGEKGLYKLLMITGSPGSGKTLCTNKVLRKLEKEGYLVISFNSNMLKSKRGIQQILAQKLLTKPHEKLQQKELTSFKFINSLQKQKVKQKCIVYVEEAQLFFNSHRDNLTEDFFDIFKNKNLKIVFLGISNTIDALKKYGPKLNIPISSVTNIVFQPYTVDQIKEIILQLIERVYKQTCIHIKMEEQLAKFAANKIDEHKKGDMRSVFEFLKDLSHYITDQKGQLINEIEVTPELVKKALCKFKNTNNLIQALPLHSQVILLGIYRHMKDTEQLAIDEKCLKARINKIYSELGLESIKQIRQILQYLATYGIIQQKKKKKEKTVEYLLKISQGEIQNNFQKHLLLSRFV